MKLLDVGMPLARIRITLGAEEWNFQLEDAYDGNIYGYTLLAPKPAKIRAADGFFRIVFFAIHPTTKDKLAVGTYHKASLIPDSHFPKLLSYFRKTGIIERRAAELQDATGFDRRKAMRVIRESITEHWLKVYCPVSQVEIFPKYFPIEVISGTQTISLHFHGYTNLQGPFQNVAARIAHQENSLESTEQPSALSEDSYYRESPSNLKKSFPVITSYQTIFALGLGRAIR